eukprot:6476716-Amphidinium_carterae.1
MVFGGWASFDWRYRLVGQIVFSVAFPTVAVPTAPPMESQFLEELRTAAEQRALAVRSRLRDGMVEFT